jgi:hypothetical protein
MLEQIRKSGRISEVGLMLRFAAATGQYGKDAGLGIRMFLRGKLNPISAAVQKVKEVRRLYDHTADGKKA